MLDWPTRCRKYATEVAEIRRWNRRDGRFAVCEIRSKLGLRPRVVAIVRHPNGEYILSRHRSVKRAKAACDAKT